MFALSHNYYSKGRNTGMQEILVLLSRVTEFADVTCLERIQSVKRRKGDPVRHSIRVPERVRGPFTTRPYHFIGVKNLQSSSRSRC